MDRDDTFLSVDIYINQLAADVSRGAFGEYILKRLQFDGDTGRTIVELLGTLSRSCRFRRVQIVYHPNAAHDPVVESYEVDAL